MLLNNHPRGKMQGIQDSPKGKFFEILGNFKCSPGNARAVPTGSVINRSHRCTESTFCLFTPSGFIAKGKNLAATHYLVQNTRMATLIVNHRVKDYATWKTGFDGDDSRRVAAGINLISVGQKMGDPGNVYIIFDVADPSILDKFMSDPELQAKMQELGVISAPEAIVID
jgi:hypothetical protein